MCWERMTVQSPACVICGKETEFEYRTFTHDMYKCLRCRTAFVHPMPSIDELAPYYARFHGLSELGGRCELCKSRAEADFPFKVKMVHNVLGNGCKRLLDFGCGKGFFLKECVDAGLEAEGIDISQAGIDYARDVLGVKATCGDSLKVLQGGKPYDAVTFWATIEHLTDPMSVLREIHEVLIPGGFLFLDTGIGDDWLDRLLPGRVQWYSPPRHLFVFSRQGIQTALEAAGFELVSLDPCFERTRLRRIARKLRNGVVATSLRAVTSLGRLNPHAMAYLVFPMGNAMNVVARKPP